MGFHEFLLFCHLVASSCFFRGGFVFDARSGGKGESVCDACWICQGPAGDGSGGHRDGRGRFSPILTVANILFQRGGEKKNTNYTTVVRFIHLELFFLLNTYIKPPLRQASFVCALFEMTIQKSTESWFLVPTRSLVFESHSETWSSVTWFDETLFQRFFAGVWYSPAQVAFFVWFCSR